LTSEEEMLFKPRDLDAERAQSEVNAHSQETVAANRDSVSSKRASTVSTRESLSSRLDAVLSGAMSKHDSVSSRLDSTAAGHSLVEAVSGEAAKDDAPALPQDHDQHSVIDAFGPHSHVIPVNSTGPHAEDEDEEITAVGTAV
jgi:hypothetical protein